MKKHIYLLTLLSFLAACATPQRGPSNTPPEGVDYAAIFSAAREILITTEPVSRETAQALKKIPEHSVVKRLQESPQSLDESRESLIQAIQIPNADHTKPTRLIPLPGTSGYSDLKLFVNHPYYRNGRLVKSSNLIQVWKDFILSAKKEIVLNVFDFDLEEVAMALIDRARAGVSVRVGIDKKSVIDLRPEVKMIEQLLIQNGVIVTGVMPVGLNHQKITAIDWSLPESAAVLFSSGNLTRSCLEPEGDLKGTVPLPKESVPNANHLITMKSWTLANLVQHELTKTIDSGFLLRGREYPLNGAYQVTGPGVDPQTLEAYPEPSIVITFTPGGGLKDVNKNLIADVIKKETGSIRMLQFAYSSKAVDEALLFRAQQDFQQTSKFDFLSVGDTPFAMREWSRFLIMSGMKRLIGDDKVSTYQLDPENPWTKGLTTRQLKSVQKRVLIAPRIYANNVVRVNGKGVKVNAKIHHKILATPRYAIIGTSFNFSEGAQSNNEQILVIRDQGLAQAVDGMVRYLAKSSPGSVYQEALRRNKLRQVEDSEAGGDPEEQLGEVSHSQGQ